MLKTRLIKSQLLVVSLLIAAYVFLGAGCAKIADPLPPEIRIPRPAVDLAVRQHSDFIILTVSRPELNTDGSPAETLQRVDVFRLIEDPNAGTSEQSLPEDQFMQRATRIQSIQSPQFSEYLHDNAFIVRDSIQLPEGSWKPQRIRYVVRFVNKKNQAAGLSNQVQIAPVPIPPPPEDLSAEVTEDFIRLKWVEPPANMDGSQPARIAGYNIYRSDDAGKLPATKINSDPVLKPEYEDRNFQFGKTYYYAVGTIGSTQHPYAESLPSKTYAASARDIFPPEPPADFNALLDNGIVLLLWSPSSSGDIAGYKIYRREKGSKARRILNNDLITIFSFRDGTAAPSKIWVYSIQAVDTWGNESNAVDVELEIP
jgi:hypothetical protein